MDLDFLPDSYMREFKDELIEMALCDYLCNYLCNLARTELDGEAAR